MHAGRGPPSTGEVRARGEHRPLGPESQRCCRFHPPPGGHPWSSAGQREVPSESGGTNPRWKDSAGSCLPPAGKASIRELGQVGASLLRPAQSPWGVPRRVGGGPCSSSPRGATAAALEAPGEGTLLVDSMWVPSGLCPNCQKAGHLGQAPGTRLRRPRPKPGRQGQQAPTGSTAGLGGSQSWWGPPALTPTNLSDSRARSGRFCPSR